MAGEVTGTTKIAAALETLDGIANATFKEWQRHGCCSSMSDFREDFLAWAQSRARHTAAQIRAVNFTAEPETATQDDSGTDGSLPADVIVGLERWRTDGPHYMAGTDGNLSLAQIGAALMAGNTLRTLLLREATGHVRALADVVRLTEELADEEKRSALHAGLNRRAAEALGKPQEGERSSWHDIPEEITALRAALATAEQDKTTAIAEGARLQSLIDCACNALTDSICMSGNDSATNLHFVGKLRRDAIPAKKGIKCAS